MVTRWHNGYRVPGPGDVVLHINGLPVSALSGTTVAAALLNAGVATFRRSPEGGARTPLCGMGTCFECRVTIDGEPHRRACMELVRDGMRVDTDA